MIPRSVYCWLLLLLIFTSCGCGTTRWSDTSRTATEQRLISNAIDDAVKQIDARTLAGKKVYFDVSQVDESVQQKYLISSLRHRLLEHGCLLQEKRDDASIVVEARAGVIGTDRHEMLVGIPETSLPAVMPGIPSQLPELALFKKTNQLGFAKIGLFAYSRPHGQLVWSSDIPVADTSAKNYWALGVGPIQSDPDGGNARLAGDEIPSLALPTLPSISAFPAAPQLTPEQQAEEPQFQMPQENSVPTETEQGKNVIQPAGTTSVIGDGS